MDSILIPMINSEIPQLKTWLRYCPSSGVRKGCIFLSIDTSWSENLKEEITRTFTRSALYDEDWDLKFVNCNMNPNESFYIKDSAAEINLDLYPYGQKSGPNMQFFRSLMALRDFTKEYPRVLLMEVDAFPIADGWAKKLNEKVPCITKDILIAGARYAGASVLSPQIQSHLNGNSIYFIGQNDFYRFLECWEKLLLSGNRIVPFLAYDIVISWYVNYKQTNIKVKSLENDNARFIEDCYRHRFLDLSKYLINYGGPVEADNSFVLDAQKFIDQHPNAIIVHGKCFNESIYKLRAMVTNSSRKCQINILNDMILNGNYDGALLLGEPDMNITRAMIARIGCLSDKQVAMIKDGWCHNVN